jgi:gas vesicle protein
MIRVPFRSGSGKTVGSAARDVAQAVAQRTPEPITVVRHKAQPVAVYVTRLTSTAVFAYLLALLLPDAGRPVLAPLTALLVVQATLFQTIRSAITRVVAVTAGVVIAVGVAATVGFTWWVLGLLIAGTLTLGYLLRLGENILEVPISAMLIFSLDTRSIATGRIVDTLVGAGAGLAAGLLFAPLRVQPAQDAVDELSKKMADLLDRMAVGLDDASALVHAGDWLAEARSLSTEIERVDDALDAAEESVKLNPRAQDSAAASVALRDGLENLEHAALTIRMLARSIADGSNLDSDESPIRDPETRDQLAKVLWELSDAVRTFGRLAGADATVGQEPLESELEQQLADAHEQQDQLADLLRADPATRPAGWPLRAEILAHVDRLRTELQADLLPRPQRRPRRRTWRVRGRRPGSRRASTRRASRRDRSRKHLSRTDRGAPH